MIATHRYALSSSQKSVYTGVFFQGLLENKVLKCTVSMKNCSVPGAFFTEESLLSFVTGYEITNNKQKGKRFQLMVLPKCQEKLKSSN